VTNQINNAKLASESTYHRLLPAFLKLLAQHRGDLNAFYAAAKTLSKMPAADREREMNRLLNQGVASE
jgi:predicted aminopeptidase